MVSDRNPFVGWDEAPSDVDVELALGKSAPLWDQLLCDLERNHLATGQEWKCYSRKRGWSLRVWSGKRTVLWMTPHQGGFRVGVILGDRALAAARAADVPPAIVRAFDEAPRYPEGTGIRLDVERPSDLPAIVKLASIKLAH